jgi:hypothetical protein
VTGVQTCALPIFFVQLWTPKMATASNRAPADRTIWRAI